MRSIPSSQLQFGDWGQMEAYLSLLIPTRGLGRVEDLQEVGFLPHVRQVHHLPSERSSGLNVRLPNFMPLSCFSAITPFENEASPTVRTISVGNHCSLQPLLHDK